MNILELDKFSKYVGNKEWNKGRKKQVLKMYDRMVSYAKKDNKDLINLTKEDCIEVVRSIESRSIKSMYQYIFHINDIMKYLGLEKISTKEDIKVQDEVKNQINRYYTQSEIIDVCDKLLNPQDKFIIYALFHGIHGKKNHELIELKSKDIDLEESKIYLSDRVIRMDEYMQDICSKMLDIVVGGIYYKYIKPEQNRRTSDSYNLNFNSEYAIKTKPYSENNNGLDSMKNEGLRRRLVKLSKVTGMSLSSTDIVRSGIMNRMNKIKKIGWTVEEVKEYLKQNNFKIEPSELTRTYNLKYSINLEDEYYNEEYLINLENEYYNEEYDNENLEDEYYNEEYDNKNLEDIEFLEGGEIQKIIKGKKRNAKTRKNKLDYFERKHGSKFCEVCKEKDEIVLDVHHDTVKVSDMKKEQNVKLSDLRVLCSNCHRKVHAYKKSVDKLIEELKNK